MAISPSLSSDRQAEAQKKTNERGILGAGRDFEFSLSVFLFRVIFSI